MGESFFELAAKYGLMSALGIWVTSVIVPRLFRARTEIAGANLQTAGLTASTDIIEALHARMTTLEAEQRQLREELDTERDKRVEAEDMLDMLTRQNTALTRRVVTLEAQLRQLGHEPL